MRCDGMLRLGENFGRVTRANHRESPRTDSLIFGRFCLSGVSFAAICAKIFLHADVLVAIDVIAKRKACSLKIWFYRACASKFCRCKKPYFIVRFQFFPVITQHDMTTRAHISTSRAFAGRSRRRVSQVARVHASLSGNAAFFSVL